MHVVTTFEPRVHLWLVDEVTTCGTNDYAGFFLHLLNNLIAATHSSSPVHQNLPEMILKNLNTSPEDSDLQDPSLVYDHQPLLEERNSKSPDTSSESSDSLSYSSIYDCQSLLEKAVTMGMPVWSTDSSHGQCTTSPTWNRTRIGICMVPFAGIFVLWYLSLNPEVSAFLCQSNPNGWMEMARYCLENWCKFLAKKVFELVIIMITYAITQHWNDHSSLTQLHKALIALLAIGIFHPLTERYISLCR